MARYGAWHYRLTWIMSGVLLLVLAAGALPVAAATPSSVTLTSSVNPSYQGQAVTFTAVVAGSGGTPTGNVAFSLPGGVALGTVPLDGSGLATLIVGMLPAGINQVVTASYSGDANFASSAAGIAQTVRPQLAITPVTLSDGTVGTSYSQTLVASGGSGTGYRFSIIGGSLPFGLTLDNTTGTLSGTPIYAGTSAFTVQVRDDAGDVFQQAESATTTGSSDAIATELGPAQVGVPFQKPAAGEVVALAAGSLPPGIGLGLLIPAGQHTAIAIITGTPTAVGTYVFVLNLHDRFGADPGNNFVYKITVNAGPVTALALDYRHLFPVNTGTASQPIIDMHTVLPLKLTATYSGGTTGTASVTWTSSDTNVATVDAAGRLTGVGSGIVTISATASNGITGQILVQVLGPVGQPGMHSGALNSVNTPPISQPMRHGDGGMGGGGAYPQVRTPPSPTTLTPVPTVVPAITTSPASVPMPLPQPARH